MIKPQFEVGRERVGKGGVVRDASARRDALVSVGRCARRAGRVRRWATPAPGLPGPKGNRETFVWLCRAGRGGAVGDLETAASRWSHWRWSLELGGMVATVVTHRRPEETGPGVRGS